MSPKPPRRDATDVYSIRNELEAEYMRGITEAIEAKLERVTDMAFIEIQKAYSDCRLHIVSAKERVKQRVEAKRALELKRAATTARVHVKHINPRFIKVEPEYKDRSEYGKRGAMAAKRARRVLT